MSLTISSRNRNSLFCFISSAEAKFATNGITAIPEGDKVIKITKLIGMDKKDENSALNW